MLILNQRRQLARLVQIVVDSLHQAVLKRHAASRFFKIVMTDRQYIL